jgi:Phasin protein
MEVVMDQNGAQDSGAPAGPEMFPAEFAEAGKKRLEDMMRLQSEFLKYLQDVNRNWLEHLQSEAALASECANKITSARSIPQTASAYQDWANRRMELFAQDGRKLLAETEEFLETGARMLADGWAKPSKF